MIPELISLPGAPWRVLPPGIHRATMDDIRDRFAYNPHRQQLFDGLMLALQSLALAGCVRLYLDGSYVTSKPVPGDFDACWDPAGVNKQALDPVFMTFSHGRQAQKVRFGGEFFPSTELAGANDRSFLEFFQLDKQSLLAKGIILINLANEPALRQGGAS